MVNLTNSICNRIYNFFSRSPSPSSEENAQRNNVNQIPQEAIDRAFAAAINNGNNRIALDLIDIALIFPNIIPSQIMYEQYINVEQIVQDGANFINQEILSDVDDNTKSLFNDCDPRIPKFIATKAIYIYVLGTRKNADIPDFFQNPTKDKIRALRESLNTVTDAQNDELQQTFQNIDTFDNTESPILKDLKTTASPEIQGSRFILKCYEEAWMTRPSRPS